MRILVTGGAGFIGSHLCDALISRGDQVTVLDNFSTGSINNITHLLKKITLFNGDIRDQNLVDTAVSRNEIVMHMAAAVGVDNILKNPIDSISTNLYGSQIVLNSAAKHKSRIFIASTSEIYGKNGNQPLAESFDRIIGQPQKFRWSYSDAKALEEATAHFLFSTQNLNVTTVRLFNTVGPRQTGDYGMVIPRFVKNAIAGTQLKILGNGLQTRTFCHINDVTSALLLLLSSDKSFGEVFNIGGLQEIAILDLAKKIISRTNSPSEIVFETKKPSNFDGYEDMQRRVPDTTKLNKLTGWRPKYDLDKISI
jgi:UDP-glucose 4-epimerase